MNSNSGKQNPPTVLLSRADRIEQQAAVAWHDGNRNATTGLLRLARRLRLQAGERDAA